MMSKKQAASAEQELSVFNLIKGTSEELTKVGDVVRDAVHNAYADAYTWAANHTPWEEPNSEALNQCQVLREAPLSHILGFSEEEPQVYGSVFTASMFDMFSKAVVSEALSRIHHEVSCYLKGTGKEADARAVGDFIRNLES